MPRNEYAQEERAAIEKLLSDPLYAGALKKFFERHQDKFTEQARNALNVIPENLHQQAKQHELAKQYAAMAKAYGMAFAELEMVAKG